MENALAAFVYGKRIAAALQQAATSARRTTELALVQYKEGQTGFTTLLQAYDSQLQVEDALVQSRGQILLGLISIYRALGGGWQIREGQSLVSTSVATAMRERTRILGWHAHRGRCQGAATKNERSIVRGRLAAL